MPEVLPGTSSRLSLNAPAARVLRGRLDRVLPGTSSRLSLNEPDRDHRGHVHTRVAGDEFPALIERIHDATRCSANALVLPGTSSRLSLNAVRVERRPLGQHVLPGTSSRLSLNVQGQ